VNRIFLIVTILSVLFAGVFGYGILHQKVTALEDGFSRARIDDHNEFGIYQIKVNECEKQNALLLQSLKSIQNDVNEIKNDVKEIKGKI